MSELALQKLNELREVAPDELGEVIDGLATLLVLRQDISNPMIGAKVTYHCRPPTTPHLCPADGVPEDTADWQQTFTSDDPERFMDWDFPWLDGEPVDAPAAATKVLVKDDPDADDLVSRRALVFDASIAEGDSDVTYWDPNRQEYTSPDDYPLGTVNVAVPETPDAEFGEDYVYGLHVETSVTPADGEPAGHTYTPGW